MRSSPSYHTDRANAQQPKLFVGMILILIFAEALALYGLIGKWRSAAVWCCSAILAQARGLLETVGAWGALRTRLTGRRAPFAIQARAQTWTLSPNASSTHPLTQLESSWPPRPALPPPSERVNPHSDRRVGPRRPAPARRSACDSKSLVCKHHVHGESGTRVA